jgi:serine O-acetyltransferase
MSIRGALTDFSKGDNLGFFWWLYRRRSQAKSRLTRDIFTFLLNRCAHRHGGYLGPGAVIQGVPELPHGLHGVFISRYAVVGTRCRIYQNVTIGEVNRKAPVIGDGCWIGAGAVLVGDIRVGKQARIGAGAVVSRDVPDYATVVSQPPRVIERGDGHGGPDHGHGPSLAGD